MVLAFGASGLECFRLLTQNIIHYGWPEKAWTGSRPLSFRAFGIHILGGIFATWTGSMPLSFGVLDMQFLRGIFFTRTGSRPLLFDAFAIHVLSGISATWTGNRPLSLRATSMQRHFRYRHWQKTILLLCTGHASNQWHSRYGPGLFFGVMCFPFSN